MAHASRWHSSIQMAILSVKRGKRNGGVDRAIDGVVDPAMFRGFYRGLGLAEGHRGLCRAQPVTDRLTTINRKGCLDGSTLKLHTFNVRTLIPYLSPLDSNT